jgi:hypothetical protein
MLCRREMTGCHSQKAPLLSSDGGSRHCRRLI